jgi:hypothetical protein
MVSTSSVRHSEDAGNGDSRHADPTRVATDFFAALAVQDWESAIGHVEPRSLAEFRQSQLAQLVSWAAHNDEIRQARSDRKTYIAMSEVVLDAELLERHGDVRLHAFAGAPTILELAALPAETFAARVLAASRIAPCAYRVFGHVLEGDDTAHVVYRPIHAGFAGDSLDVAVLHARRHDGRWRVLLSHELADAAFILFHLDDPDDRDESLQAGEL